MTRQERMSFNSQAKQMAIQNREFNKMTSRSMHLPTNIKKIRRILSNANR